ncbi:MAG: phosphate signaling complex protein PhoU [Chloroflexota bacterium]
MNLTAVILARNEAQHIAQTVASVVFADQVIVFDSGSTDGTQELAQAAGAAVLHHPFENYAQQRNAALDAAAAAGADWVLFVDADERVSDDLAEEVIREDKQINRLEVEIDDFCLRILALEQPVARDLRFIIGSFHITEALERIGDQSTNIAEKTLFINLKPELPIMNMVKTMSEIVGEMLGEVITAYNNMDDALSLRIREMDSRVDDLNQKIVKTIIDEMGCEASTIGRGVNIIAVSSYLERVADLATNIAEDVVFISRGRNIKHSSHFDYQE